MHLVATSWDDGVRDDLRMAELLTKYKLPGTFYIPGVTKLTPAEIVELSKTFTIGSHTMHHPLDIKQFEFADQELEISGCIDYLQSVLGFKPTTYCHVRGRYDLRTLEILKKLGVTNARTTIVGKLDPGPDPLREKTTVHVFQRKEYNGKPWLQYARDMLSRWKREGGTYHVWGHSWEVDRDRNWHDLELLFGELRAAMDEVKY